MAWNGLRVFDLRRDQADPERIAESIRGGVAAVGTNLWVLIFAIMVASIGLNVNSTAVIIGAMLISPLMGPIVAIGFGAATNDFPLIRAAFRSLALMVGLSLGTATLYFLATPLGEAHSELLARTTPTIWDVLIAFFGGAAGIVALTRREGGTVVPGVAIATALMPPLCTAGYGLATQRWDFFGGALFLFLINGVFIALATLLFAKLMRLPERTAVDDATRRRHALVVGVLVLAVAAPSAYLGWQLVQRERFDATVQDVLATSIDGDEALVIDRRVDASARRVVVTVAGTDVDALRVRLAGAFAQRGLQDLDLVVREPAGGRVDTTALREELRRDLFASTVARLEASEAALRTAREALSASERESATRDALLLELRAQFPEATSVAVAFGAEAGDAGAPARLLVAQVRTPTPPAPELVATLERGWQARFPDRTVRLDVVPTGADAEPSP